MNAIVLIGIPASGKSTFFRHRLVDTHVRINRDMLKTVHRIKALVATCCSAGIPFCADNTNVTRRERQVFIGPAKKAGFSVEGIFFESKIAACVARNATRPDEERIPEAGVRGRRNELELPSTDEGFDTLWFARIAGEGQFVLTPWAEG